MSAFRIGIISLFPQMFSALEHSIPGRAQQQELLQLDFWDPRDYTDDPHRTVDDRPYGGGPSMVMKYAPLKDAILTAQQALQPAKVIHLSPQGRSLNQQDLPKLLSQNLILLCSRYEGVDQRLIDAHVDEELSIGDYVVSGGELPAMVLIDALCRLIPGSLGHPLSAEQDSYTNNLLDCPHYTRPETIADQKVPKVLLSGDHTAIERWRLQQSLGRTWQKRPDLLKRRTLTELEQELLGEYRKQHSQPNDEEIQ